MYADNIMKLMKHTMKGERGREEWGYNGRGELVQGALCACMDISKRNPLILVKYYKQKITLKIKK
jgi:hypothetical protein